MTNLNDGPYQHHDANGLVLTVARHLVRVDIQPDCSPYDVEQRDWNTNDQSHFFREYTQHNRAQCDTASDLQKDWQTDGERVVVTVGIAPVIFPGDHQRGNGQCQRTAKEHSTAEALVFFIHPCFQK